MIRTKSISIPTPRTSIMTRVVWAIADGLRWVNRNHNDYDIRAMAGELTVAERRAEAKEDRENYNQHMISAAFYADSKTYVDFDGKVSHV